MEVNIPCYTISKFFLSILLKTFQSNLPKAERAVLTNILLETVREKSMLLAKIRNVLNKECFTCCETLPVTSFSGLKLIA